MTNPTTFIYGYADMLNELYWNKGLSVRQIARQQGMSAAGMFRRFEKYCINLRPQVDLPLNRFMSKVIKDDSGCWFWKGVIGSNGYSKIWYQGKEQLAHRVGYQLLIGEIPQGTELDHLCRNPQCVNPKHLEAVTHRENIIRGMHPNVINHRNGTCSRGHSLADAIRDKNGRVRNCRTCLKEIKEKIICL
jgi:hypothetical protein